MESGGLASAPAVLPHGDGRWPHDQAVTEGSARGGVPHGKKEKERVALTES